MRFHRLLATSAQSCTRKFFLATSKDFHDVRINKDVIREYLEGRQDKRGKSRTLDDVHFVTVEIYNEK